jgi:hypothetical protein
MRKKYQTTPHMPFSPGVSRADKVLKSLRHFYGKEVVISKKMDGENSNLYTDGFHAKSVDSKHHPSRDWLARFHAQMAHNIPAGWRVCGENMYAKHSLAYDNLPSYFLAFSVWNEHNWALSWDDTVEMLALLELQSVPVLYRGIFDEAVIHRLVAELDLSKDEGLVMRLAAEFSYEDFGTSIAKWVRANHVETSDHWMHSAIVPNKLAATQKDG